MKKKQIIATLTAAMCCMGTVSVPSMTMVSAAESAGITAQTADLDSIVSAISNYLNESGIYGKVNIYIRNGEQAVAVTLGSSVDVEKVQAFVKEKGLDSSYISYFADDYSGEMLLEKEVHAINYAASISTYMTENGIKGYIYQKQDCDILVVVCKTNEGISSVKSFAKEHGFKAELLEYTLPDFEIEAPAIAPTDLEEIRQILDEFIKQNGLNGYTTIRPRKGEDKVWVMLDSVKDEYTRKIEYFLSEYGIDLNSVIVDMETSATGEPIVVGNSENTTDPIIVENSENTTEPVVVEHSEEKEELLMNVAGSISQFMEANSIEGYIYQKQDSDVVVVVCKTDDGISQIKAFVINKGYRADRIEYTLPDFEVEAPATAPTDLEDIRHILDDFIKQNGLNGYTTIRPRKGEDKVWVILDSIKDEYTRKIEFFMSLYGIDKNNVIIDTETINASEPVVVEHSDDKDEPIMHVAASISTFMEENSIEGYIYQKQDSEVLVIVCKTNDGISQVKSFVADKGYRTDRLEYTLPDFEVNPPAQLSGNLEDYRQVIDEFIKQNGISGYTKIADYKGEEKIWVILDTLTDEYTRKIESFIVQYGIDKNSVIIDTEVINPTQSDTNNKNIASDDELAQWAIKDYQDKTGFTAASAEVKPISDDKYEIVLKDADGNILDTYTINPETGIGTDSSNEAVDLPQTGNNSTRNLFVAGQGYRFTLELAAKQMADKIHAKVVFSDGTEKDFSDEYSVKEFLNDYISTGDDENLKAFAQATLNYGAYAQKFFDYNTEDLAAELADFSDVSAEQITDPASSIPKNVGDEIEFAGAALTLEGETSIKLYFELTGEFRDPDDHTIKYNGKKLEMQASNVSDVWYVTIPGIKAKQLGNVFKFTVDGTEYEYSPYTYMNKVLTNWEDTKYPYLHDLLNALYAYSTAANKC